jgi:hypothetical protein
MSWHLLYLLIEPSATALHPFSDVDYFIVIVWATTWVVNVIDKPILQIVNDSENVPLGYLAHYFATFLQMIE